MTCAWTFGGALQRYRDASVIGMSGVLAPGSRLDLPPASVRPRRALLPPVWPIYGIFVLLPFWWIAGLGGFVTAGLAAPVLVSLLFHRRVWVPKGFGIWLAFLVWCAISATQVADSRMGFSLAYRASIYVAATALFLYVLNHRTEDLPASSVITALGAFWVVTVIGGLVGMVLPAVSIRTPMQAILPQGLLADRFVSDLVSATTSSARAFSAYPIHRPKAPFIYTNEWGATFAMTLPFALGSLRYLRRKLSRDLMVLLLLGSVIPLVFSLDRGAWLSAGGAMAYATFRLARGRNAQVFKAVALGAIVIGALLFVTPLGQIIVLRLNHGYGDAHRAFLYRTSFELVKQSPLVGYGAPVNVEGNLAAGTHGQLWTVLVSQGFVGLLFFAGFLLWALWKASRRLPLGHPGDAHARFWCEVAIFTAIIQMPYYDLLPWGLPIALIAAAVAWREWRAPWVRISPPHPLTASLEPGST
jgi:polysaccharide biosynthesis protein PslJ